MGNSPERKPPLLLHRVVRKYHTTRQGAGYCSTTKYYNPYPIRTGPAYLPAVYNHAFAIALMCVNNLCRHEHDQLLSFKTAFPNLYTNRLLRFSPTSLPRGSRSDSFESGDEDKMTRTHYTNDGVNKPVLKLLPPVDDTIFPPEPREKTNTHLIKKIKKKF